jgi:hypothetical protein
MGTLDLRKTQKTKKFITTNISQSLIVQSKGKPRKKLKIHKKYEFLKFLDC